jgi:acyl-CoA synthetase (AMP-forming)/AMP-acid ligase II
MGLGNILRRSAARFPDKTALIFKERRMTYQELDRRVNRLANGFLKMGVQKGDRLAVLLHNCPEFIEIYFACTKSGAVFVPINNLLKETELARIIEYIQPRFLIADPDFEQVSRSVAGSRDCTEFMISLTGEPSEPFTSYEAVLEKGNPAEPEISVSHDDVMGIFLTSGTTGLPKGAMRTHGQNLINAMTGAIELKLAYDDRALLLFPFYHVTFEDQIRHFMMGNTVCMRREGRFDPKEVLEILEREQITICQFVPTMINAMLQEKTIESYDLTHLRLIPYAASPMPVELLRRAMQRFKRQFIHFYGQTETGPMTTVLKPEDHVLEGSEAQVARLASAGRATLDFEVRIVDQDGQDVAVGEVGEIIVRSEAMTIGYWNLPEETARTIRDGWLHTGDFGKFDEEKYVFIVDRKNDMIISGGKNIYPREIEEVIYTHEAVLEAAVVGVPDDYWGESVKALVVLKEGMNATEDEIIDLCKEKLANYKKPKSVEFRHELPKNATGKILKRVIRNEYWKGRDRAV